MIPFAVDTSRSLARRASAAALLSGSLLAGFLLGCGEPVSVRPPGRVGESANARANPLDSRVKGNDSDYVATPGGWWYHRSCIHEIEDGARVSLNHKVTRKDGTSYQIPACPYQSFRSRPGTAPTTSPTNNGWIEDAYVSEPSGNWYSQLNANWAVPAVPAVSYNSSQTYFSFPGLESDTYILQPVLQWGTSMAGGGNNWSYASWQCDGQGGYCIHSTLRPASAGDAMTGTVAASNCSNGTCTWTITTNDVTKNVRTILTIVEIQNYWFATGGAVEVYGLTNCGQYPSTGIFYTGITLYDRYGTLQTPGWASSVQTGASPFCGFSVGSTTSTVSLYHNPPPPPPPTINSVVTDPSPAKQYTPLTLTINGQLFDPATAQINWTQGCAPGPGCQQATWPNGYFTSKTSTQLVIYPLTFGNAGPIYVQEQNGPGGPASNWASFTVQPIH